MKYRYLLFGLMEYYPNGGISDLIFGFNDIEEFSEKTNAINLIYDWYQVVNLQKFQKGIVDTETMSWKISDIKQKTDKEPNNNDNIIESSTQNEDLAEEEFLLNAVKSMIDKWES